jgi:hypothetical protein
VNKGGLIRIAAKPRAINKTVIAAAMTYNAVITGSYN